MTDQTINFRKTRAAAQGPVLTYLTSNADRVITVDELCREIPGPTRGGIREAVRRLAGMYPTQMERHGTHAATWHSQEQEPQPQQPDQPDQPDLIMLTIVHGNPDGPFVGRDEDTQTLYQCKPLEW